MREAITKISAALSKIALVRGYICLVLGVTAVRISLEGFN
jgi:hypothetical protein